MVALTPHHHHPQILYSHIDNVSTLQLETARRAATLRNELDAALAALLGDDGVLDLKSAAADAADAARRARLSDADAAARLASARRAWVWTVVAAFSLGRVPPPTTPAAKPVLALPPPKGWVAPAAAPVARQAGWVESAEAKSPYVDATADADASATPTLLGMLPFFTVFRRQGRA